jgi:AcrR family transcriptional regulator
MPRNTQTKEQEKRLLPIISEAFCELGYRRATTAELAHRCKVRENILYRLWPDKKAMFLAAIQDIFRSRADRWHAIVENHRGDDDVLDRIIEYESHHHGDTGFYRIVFTALAEIDDDEIRTALVGMYKSFHKLVCRQIASQQECPGRPNTLPAEMSAWGLLGLATVSHIIRELNLITPQARARTFEAVAKRIVSGGNS